MKLVFYKSFSKMENSYNFQLSLQWENIYNSANAMQVGENIIAMTTILQEVANSLLSDKEKQGFSIEIKWFEKWSFVTEFQLVLWMIPMLPLGITSIKDVFDFTKNYFEFRKFLQWEEPKTVKELPNNQMEVTNHQGEKSVIHQQIYNYTNNYTINWNVEKIFADPQKAERISIKEPGKNWEFVETFSVSEDESEFFEAIWTEDDEKEAEISIEKIEITFVVVSLEEKYSSRFKALWRTFHAKIIDEAYWQNPPRVKKWDKLQVEMEVSITKNEKKRFRILKVIEYIPAPEQLSTEGL